MWPLGAPTLSRVLTALTGDTSRAEDLRLRLVSIAGASEIRAGAYTRPMLRRDLRSFGLLAEAPEFIHARPQTRVAESKLRAQDIRFVETTGTGEKFSIDRSVVVEELVQLMVNSPTAQHHYCSWGTRRGEVCSRPSSCGFHQIRWRRRTRGEPPRLASRRYRFAGGSGNGSRRIALCSSICSKECFCSGRS